jgi:hypothetical protein
VLAEVMSLAEWMSEGNVLDTGVDSLPSLGLVAEGMLTVEVVRMFKPV